MWEKKQNMYHLTMYQLFRGRWRYRTATSRLQETGNRKQGTGKREQETRNREYAILAGKSANRHLVQDL